MKKTITIISMLSALVTLSFASCSFREAQALYPSLSGNALMVIGFNDESRASEISEIKTEIRARSLQKPVSFRTTNVSEAMTKKLTSLPINEDVEVRLVAYNKNKKEIATSCQHIYLNGRDESVIEFIFE